MQFNLLIGNTGFNSVRRSDRFWSGLSPYLVIEQTFDESHQRPKWADKRPWTDWKCAHAVDWNTASYCSCPPMPFRDDKSTLCIATTRWCWCVQSSARLQWLAEVSWLARRLPTIHSQSVIHSCKVCRPALLLMKLMAYHVTVLKRLVHHSTSVGMRSVFTTWAWGSLTRSERLRLCSLNPHRRKQSRSRAMTTFSIECCYLQNAQPMFQASSTMSWCHGLYLCARTVAWGRGTKLT